MYLKHASCWHYRLHHRGIWHLHTQPLAALPTDSQLLQCCTWYVVAVCSWASSIQLFWLNSASSNIVLLAACSALAFAPRQQGLLLAVACQDRPGTAAVQLGGAPAGSSVVLYEAAGIASEQLLWTQLGKIQVG